MNYLYIIRGAPGSGKSTLAKRLDAEYHFEADMFFESIGGYDNKRIKEAHQWCQESTLKAMTTGENIVVSNTFIKIWEMQPYIDMAKNNGYYVSEIIMRGYFGSIHAVPHDKIIQMHKNLEIRS